MKTQILLIIIGAFIVSCSDNLKETIKSKEDLNVQLKNGEVDIRNGILVFADQSTMVDYINGKTLISRSEYVNNFVSQKDLFNKIVEEDLKWADYCSSLSKEERSQVKDHSNLYYSSLKEGIIREIYYDDGSVSYDLNIAIPFYSKIINKAGFCMVGNVIYQVTPSCVKKWINGDINNLSKLKNAEITNEEENIYVANYKESNLLTRTLFPGTQINDQSMGVALNYGGDKRQIVTFYDRTVITSPNTYDREVYIQIAHQKKNGSSWIFNPSGYKFTIKCGITGSDNPTKQTIFGSADMTNSGSNDCYTIQLTYQYIQNGQFVQHLSDIYWYVNYIVCTLNPVNVESGIIFEGTRDSYTAGRMHYWFGENAMVYQLTELVPLPGK